MTIREQWEGYRDKVYEGIELSKTQERECARAFYAGMMAGFMNLLEISNDTEDDSEEAAAAKVEAFKEELLEAAGEMIK